VKFKSFIATCFLIMFISGRCLSDDTAFIAMNGDCRYPTVVTEGNSMFMAWLATEGRPVNLYFRQSTDEGRTWDSARKISNENGYCLPPSIAVHSGIVHLAWIDCGEVLDGEIYYNRSLDGGKTWEKNSVLIENANSAQYPLITCGGSNVYLIWQDVQTKVFFKVSHDQGQTWEKETFLGEVGKHSCYCFPPALSVNGDELMVVWNDIKEDKKGFNVRLFGHPLFKTDNEKRISSIVCRKSTDNGRTWSNGQVLTSTKVSKEMKDEIYNPTMFSDGSRSYLFWQDKHKLPLGEIMYAGFDPAKKQGPIRGKPLYSIPKRSPKCPSVVFDNDKNLHFTWTTFFGGESIVHYSTIDPAGNSLKEKKDLTLHAGYYNNPLIVRTSSGLLHIFWFTKPKDKKVLSRIFLKTSKDNGSTWENRGSQTGNIQK
jgi:Neuraminidase (sialidase)